MSKRRQYQKKNRLQRRTDNEKKHLSIINKGKIVSKEVRDKISLTTKGIQKPLKFKPPTQKLEIQNVIDIKEKMCEGLTNREIISLYAHLPLNMFMLADIRAKRTWSKIKGSCEHFH